PSPRAPVAGIAEALASEPGFRQRLCDELASEPVVTECTGERLEQIGGVAAAELDECLRVASGSPQQFRIRTGSDRVVHRLYLPQLGLRVSRVVLIQVIALATRADARDRSGAA